MNHILAVHPILDHPRIVLPGVGGQRLNPLDNLFS